MILLNSPTFADTPHKGLKRVYDTELNGILPLKA